MNLGWGVSGNGMAARAAIEAAESGLLTTKIKVVVIDRPSPISAYCDAHGVRCVSVSASSVDRDLIAARAEYDLTWLALTFNRLISPATIAAFRHQIFNLHMSMLPKYPGVGAIRKALASGESETGVTIHIVDAGMDSGPILAQAPCPILSGDTVATLGRRQFAIALPLLLQIIRYIEKGGLIVASNDLPSRETKPHLPIDHDVRIFSERWMLNLNP